LSEKRTTKKAHKPPAKTSAAPANSPIDFGLLAQIVELMSTNDLNTVDVRDGDRRVILKRGAVSGPIQMVQAPTAFAPPAQQAAPLPGGSSAPPAPAATQDENRYHKITSPMVGTFYASPKPGEKAFVAVGSVVNEDSDVCIIEAMKTFNNIKAECQGTIARILVQDGHPVEFGTVLFLVKPS
jgi:acetyl-CoA carboxylase biotin carboxyl carrier protein